MTVILYIAMGIALLTTVIALTRLNAIHALLYLITSLLAIAVVFFLLGAHFAAALEVIIYAGAIMVLFVFTVMMLNLGPPAIEQERRWFVPGMWAGPGIFLLMLLGEIIYLVYNLRGIETSGTGGSPSEVGVSLYTTYLLGIEISSMLLLAGVVGAYHLGRRAILPVAEEPTRPLLLTEGRKS